jgi:hypothetical protein
MLNQFHQLLTGGEMVAEVLPDGGLLVAYLMVASRKSGPMTAAFWSLVNGRGFD